MVGRMTGQIAGRVALILLAGVVVAGASYAFSLTPASAAVTSAVGAARGGGPPGAVPNGGAAPANPNARRGPNAGAVAGAGAAPAGPGGVQRPGGGRPADLARGLPEFGRYVATLVGIVLVAVLVGEGTATLTGTRRGRQRPAAT